MNRFTYPNTKNIIASTHAGVNELGRAQKLVERRMLTCLARVGAMLATDAQFRERGKGPPMQEREHEPNPSGEKGSGLLSHRMGED